MNWMRVHNVMTKEEREALVRRQEPEFKVDSWDGWHACYMDIEIIEITECES